MNIPCHCRHFKIFAWLILRELFTNILFNLPDRDGSSNRVVTVNDSKDSLDHFINIDNFVEVLFALLCDLQYAESQEVGTKVKGKNVIIL